MANLRIKSVALFLLTLVSGLALRADEAEENTTLREAPITKEDREHWAFRRLFRPEVPKLKSRLRFSNPIDAFIEAVDQAGRQRLLVAHNDEIDVLVAGRSHERILVIDRQREVRAETLGPGAAGRDEEIVQPW